MYHDLMNGVLQEPRASSIRELLVEEEQNLIHVLDKIALSPSLLDTDGIQYISCRSKIDTYRAILSPVRRLPPEIVSEIFLLLMWSRNFEDVVYERTFQSSTVHRSSDDLSHLPFLEANCFRLLEPLDEHPPLFHSSQLQVWRRAERHDDVDRPHELESFLNKNLCRKPRCLFRRHRQGSHTSYLNLPKLHSNHSILPFRSARSIDTILWSTPSFGTSDTLCELQTPDQLPI